MTDASFIGAIDLTVHLSSMNPLGHIDAREASKSFERILMQAAWYTARESKEADDLLQNGLIVEGPGAKYFRMRALDDLVRFCLKAREMLIQARLPFKLCVRTGELTNAPLEQLWQPTIEAAAAGDRGARGRLIQEFNTDKPEEIATIFKLYRAPGFKNDAVELAMDMEDFKGLGISFDGTLWRKVSTDDRFFRNYYPSRSTRAPLDMREFIDCKFDLTDDDFIMRHVVGSRDGVPAALDGDEQETAVVEQRPAGGGAALIDGGLDLMRRSFNANAEHGAYYLSFLMTVVRSSPFGSLRYLENRTLDETGEVTLAAGWQGEPVIFDALLGTLHRQMLKAIPGIEYVLGALLDEVFSAAVDALTSASLQQAAHVPAAKVTSAAASPTFRQTVLRVQSAYGKPIMRRMFKLPNHVVGEQAKRAILAVASA